MTVFIRKFLSTDCRRQPRDVILSILCGRSVSPLPHSGSLPPPPGSLPPSVCALSLSGGELSPEHPPLPTRPPPLHLPFKSSEHSLLLTAQATSFDSAIPTHYQKSICSTPNYRKSTISRNHSLCSQRPSEVTQYAPSAPPNSPLLYNITSNKSLIPRTFVIPDEFVVSTKSPIHLTCPSSPYYFKSPMSPHCKSPIPKRFGCESPLEKSKFCHSPTMSSHFYFPASPQPSLRNSPRAEHM